MRSFHRDKKDRPEERSKSREETPKKGMRPEERNQLLTLHCELSKPLRGLFALCDGSDAGQTASVLMPPSRIGQSH